MNADDVLNFWFSREEHWFRASAAFDEEIRAGFFDTWQQASRGELAHWRVNGPGRLAEIIVLDQFSRNLHRHSPLAFAADLAALVLSQEALPAIHELTPPQRHFLLLPFMHSESLAIHRQARPLFARWTNGQVLAIEDAHREIIERFGRYPHRNAILGRASSAAEIAYLENGGRTF